VIALALLSAAHAAPNLELSGGIGASWGVNDPFVKRRGLDASGQLLLQDMLVVRVYGSWMPGLGEWDRTGLTQQLEQQFMVQPDISRMVARADLSVGILPFQYSVGRVTTRAGFTVSGGAVHTKDDLDALQSRGDPVAEATADQWHALGGAGVQAELWWSVVGVRVRAERIFYTEVVNSTTLETKQPRRVGVEMTLRRPAPTSTPDPR
jgi:hypothetical protein